MDSFSFLPSWVWKASALLVLITLLCKKYIFNFGTKTSYNGYLPRVSSHDIFGIGLFITVGRQFKEHRIFQWVNDRLKVPGRTFDMNLFRLRLIFTDEPENFKAAFSSQFSDFGKGEFGQKLMGNLGKGFLITLDGAHWRVKRKELRPHVSTITENDHQITELHFQQLLKQLSQSKTPVDVYDLVHKMELDITIHRFIGRLTTRDGAGYQRFVSARRAMAFAGTTKGLIGPLGFLVTPIERKAKRDLDSYINSLLLKADSSIFTKDDVEIEQKRELLLNQLIAGKDSVVITITWAIYELSRNPEAVKKLRSEISQCLGFTQLPDHSTLERMSYLNNIVRETLRLYPTTGLNFREALQDTTLPRGGGEDGAQPVPVSKGQVVIFSSFCMQRRPEYFGLDANCWRPERWENWSPVDCTYVPFGTGPRTCPGKGFGQFQAAYTLARIFQEFESVSGYNNSGEPSLKFEILTKPGMKIACVFNKGEKC